MFYKRQRKQRPALEISLTPLIDTALTLLIIFMVTTPMIHKNAIKVNLPKGQSKEGGSQQPELVVTIDKQEMLFFNNEPVTLETLPEKIKTCCATMAADTRRVWVCVDETCPTRCLISTIDCIKVLGGVKDVAIATEQTIKTS